MINGLKLTMSGDDLKKRLAARIKEHEGLIEDCRKQVQAPSGEQPPAWQCVAEQACQYEIDAHEDSIETLRLIHDHVLDGEVYLLGERDLQFAEMLPESSS